MLRSRRWRIAILSIGAAFLLLLGGALIWLNTPAAARHVAGALGDVLGAKVEVEGISVGFGQSKLQKVSIRPLDGPAGCEPWLTVENIELDLSLFAALFGDHQPNEIVLYRPAVTLRLDRDNQLRTVLPRTQPGDTRGPIPRIRMVNGSLILHQEGRETSTFKGISAVISPNGHEVVLDGKLDDPAWGEWTLSGNFESHSVKGTARLETVARDINQAYLARVPLVPASVWDEVQLEGRTPARIDLQFDPANEPALRYRVELEPVNTIVNVTSIRLAATRAAGKVIIEDGVVTLRGVTAEAADGKLLVDSEMDFRAKDSKLHYKARAERLDVQKLPEEWGLPTKISGRLTGSADLTLTVTEKGTRADGVGRAVIEEAKLGTIPADPIVLTLRPAGHRFSFQRGAEKEKREEPPPAPEPPKDPDKKPSTNGFVSLVLKWLAFVIEPDAKQADRTYLTINLGLTDVDVTEALKQLNIIAPVSLAGKITVKVTADVPTDSPDDFKSYRLRGTVSSKRLEIEGVPIEDLSARVDVRNPILTMQEFSGRLATTSKTAGKFSGSGDMRLTEAYPFRVKLDLTGIDMAAAERALPFTLRGMLNGNAALEGTLTPLSVRGGGTIKATGARIGILPLDELSFNIVADGERLKIESAKATLLQGEMTASATIPLRDSAGGKATIELKNVDLGELSKQLPPTLKLRFEGQASGAVMATIPAKKGDEPRQVNAEIDLQAPKLKFQNIAAERIKGTATYSAGKLNYKLTGAALGGTFEVDGQYPSAPKQAEPKEAGPSGKLSLERMRLSRLRRELQLPDFLIGIDGEIFLEMNYRIQEDGDITGVGSLHVDRIRWKDREIIPRLRATVRLTESQLRLEGLSAPVGEGEARGLVILNLADLNRSRLILTLARVQASSLFEELPALRDNISGRVDVQVRSTLGRQLRGDGTITLPTGSIAGAPARDVRIPLEWNVIPDRGGGDVNTRDVTGTVAQGSVKGKATLTLFQDTAPRLSGELLFTNLNLQTLNSSVESVSGSNQVSGRFDFAAQQLRSVNDLTGTLNATLGETKPFQIPVLSDILPFLGTGRSNQASAKGGEVRATLSNGIFRVQRFAITGTALNIFGDGTVTLGGQLNMDVVVSTRTFPIDPGVLRILGIRVPLTVGPIPVGVILEVSRLLSNRVIYLSVTGTLKNPTIRVKTLETLSEAGVRYFLERSLSVP